MIWLLPLLIACGANRANIDPAPGWTNPAGRETAKTELAAALLESGNPEAALRLIGKMRDEGAKGPELSVLQGKAMARIGLTEDAEAILRGVARRHPAQAEAHNQLGILLMDQKRIAEAIDRFKSAARAAPKNAEMHNNLGFALMAAGRHPEAVEVLREALKLDSSQARTRNNLGFALVASKQDGAAWRVFRAGTDAATAHTNLALAQELRGDLVAARASYAKALVADPGRAVAVDALKRLAPPSDTAPTEDTPPTEDAPPAVDAPAGEDTPSVKDTPPDPEVSSPLDKDTP